MERDEKKENSSKFIPRVITDEIFLRLPIKSLLRFSSVSKSWNSSILSNVWLADKYRGRKALVFEGSAGKNVSSLALSNDRNQTGDDVTMTTIVCPFSEKSRTLVASTDTLLCAKVWSSLCLWNPWTGTYREIREPSFRGMYFIRGLGYDAIADDYKMLSVDYLSRELELYSLRSDSWRKIPSHHSYQFKSYNFVSVSGTFHWIDNEDTIISFNLSTEKFGEVTGPNCPALFRSSSLELAACNGKLCVCAHYRHRCKPVRYVMWTMEDYGNAESWTKTFEISFDKTPIRAVMKKDYCLKYLHSYDDGRILIEASDTRDEVLILVYEDNKVVPLNNVSQKIRNCFLLIESFVSPNMY